MSISAARQHTCAPAVLAPPRHMQLMGNLLDHQLQWTGMTCCLQGQPKLQSVLICCCYLCKFHAAVIIMTVRSDHAPVESEHGATPILAQMQGEVKDIFAMPVLSTAVLNTVLT